MEEHGHHRFLRAFWSWLVSPRLTVVCLAFLMVLTFWGTVHQVEHGLYAAQERFYNSWYLLIGGAVPFPGTQLVLAVLLVNLLGYLGKSLMSERLKPGIVTIHLGLLLLLVGGAITHYMAEESQLTLEEGQSSNVSAAYHEWELAVWTDDEGGARTVVATDAAGLRPGDDVAFPGTPLRVAVESYFPHARAFQSQEVPPPDAPLNRFGITRIEAAPREKEPERHQAAGVFLVAAERQEPVRVLLFDEDTVPRKVTAGGRSYEFGLRRKRYPLPVDVKLLDFRRDMHPGTEIARSFSSVVEVFADGLRRNLTISMNKPLRHRGYTLYQSSYRESPDGTQFSTFAVARNYGRLIPYVATGMMVLGMVVHFAGMMARGAGGRRAGP